MSQYLVTDQAVLVRRKTCQLMAAAARLHQARETTDFQDKIGIRTSDPTDPTTSILSMYEYEAKHGLGRSDSDSALERLSALPNPDPKTFEAIAALAMQGPEKRRGSAVKALKWSIHFHLQRPEPNWSRLSKCYHSYVQLVMEGEKGGDKVSMETAWGILEEVVDLLENRAEVLDNSICCSLQTFGASYPEMEVLWLLTKSWNCGIHQYRWFNMPHYIFPSPSTLSAGEALSPSCCFYPILKVSMSNTTKRRSSGVEWE
ncbi:Testis-expressed protein 11 [Geodia barretti]|uniref:Testis-expressed protein 11 n=1 Tax=Geodia barretti TaxID=519541 RepID=A0AA35S2S3_GEOBA|nr:Testis-expressed protein 11 [Geodia barretti]